MKKTTLDDVKLQILRVLGHPEADEGLYLRNFSHLHQEDERPAVEAPEKLILEALNVLVGEGKVRIDESEGDVVFQLAQQCAV